MVINVFCGASFGNDSIYDEKAKELGKWIADNGHILLYGGSYVGLMGSICKAVLENNGKVIGVLPRLFWDLDPEDAPEGYTSIHVEDLSERKTKMTELADAFIALPGGLGTLDEFSEVLTQMQLYGNVRPCILYDVNGYYQAIRSFFVDMLLAGFVKEKNLDCLLISEDWAEIVEFMQERNGK